METIDFKEHAHRRMNILTGEWVLVSPHRTKRPWQGKMEALPADNRPQYDPNCYLCPGNKRADGSLNETYTEPFVFTNDFSALLHDTPKGSYNLNDLLIAKTEKGICRVISFSPRHDLTLPNMSEIDIKKVIDLWQKEFKNLAANPFIKYIQIFENKGDIMGCSNPHPHGQIWATSELPVEIEKEQKQLFQYYQKHKRSLLFDYLQIELKLQERIVIENEHFVALVPFWAVWPFETMIISKTHKQDITQFDNNEKNSLAKILKQLLQKYDLLFNVSFPYSGGIHQQPVNDGEHPEWHWHMHFYPPLLRSATVKKFMVGYEMLANPQRDITAETAATTLKNLNINL
ncbi:MAG: UDP-glucose--hexose-1-phosphate uridylyltransferase [Alphaproteobacteria bacterium]|nr:UDP-glucose--hexose-1-phosphate uridylyltransferase [Alphaproteobacteria bacterium]